jgi:hypothetical protein
MTKRRYLLLLFVAAGCVSAAVTIQLRRGEREAIRAAAELHREAEADARQPTQIPRVAQTLRALKLVTVEIRASVESASADESWRGDVHASVRAPVTLYYGVDLSGLSAEAIRRDALTGTISITVPRPIRIATEVLGSDELSSVEVSGTRFRDVAGEYHLGLARTGLYERARRMALSEVDRRHLDEATRAQIAGLVRALTGADARVNVEFVSVEPAVASPEPGAAEPVGGGR